MSMQLTILGCGNMGRAILSGVLRAGLVPAQQVPQRALPGPWWAGWPRGP